MLYIMIWVQITSNAPASETSAMLTKQGRFGKHVESWHFIGISIVLVSHLDERTYNDIFINLEVYVTSNRATEIL
jgi:hypothetical protein